ncbi:DUF4097 family beta strand repeat-containing protein [Kitasatospora sp. NPDC085464]|uniref:DUF4097 family beta strand repeat-containing protein n=1 Tax=Kitasatospora sp. NPDC085464 TaxID=3364063 RepID=UPI0037C5D22E
MTTTRTFLATHAQQLAMVMPTGHIRVSIDPAATAITVLLSTPDDDGPSADAVRRSRSWEDHNRLSIDVPAPDNGFTHIGGNTVYQSFGTVTGNVTGITIVNGRVIVGGQQPTSAITATITLPPTALGVALQSVSADLTVTGHLPVLAFSSTSGDVRVQSVNVLSATTVSGDVVAERTGGDVEIRSTSGDVRIGVHEGHIADIRTVSGDVRLTAGTRATGTLNARTVSGDIELHGTGRLDVRTRTVSGRARRH